MGLHHLVSYKMHSLMNCPILVLEEVEVKIYVFNAYYVPKKTLSPTPHSHVFAECIRSGNKHNIQHNFFRNTTSGSQLL